MKNKRLLASALAAAILLSASVLAGCNDDTPDDDFDPDSPGDEFSGSITDNNGGGETPETPIDEGDETKTYYISNADELLAMKRKGTYILTADIDISDKEWTPIGTFESPFSGTFDGAGYTITGLTVTKDIEGTGECISYTYSYAGLIGYAKGATIKNVSLEDININVNSTGEYRVVYAGGIAGMTVDSTVTDCKVLSGEITASSTFFKAYSAGITAFSFESAFSGCTVNADISVTDSGISSVAGGILSQCGMKTVVTGCETFGTVSALSTDGNSYSGGIAGYVNNSTISHCASSSNVSAVTECNESEKGKAGACFAGGVAAYVTNTLSETVSISVVSSIGTVTAASADYTSYAGGITGYVSFASLTHAYSSSAVTAHSDIRESFAGGISAYNSSHVSFDGVFFAGSLTVEATNDDAWSGLLMAYDIPDEESPTVIKNFAYTTLADMTVKVNGASYGSADFPSDDFVIKGEEYSAAELRSKNILTGDLGWNAEDWTFTMSGYPSVVMP